MSKTVVGVFDSYSRAEQVARGLESEGYSSSDISVVANDHKGEYTNEAGETVGHTASGAGTGAAIGGVAGLALGLVALAIPGVGPIIAMGPLAAALTGAGVGAAAGGLIGGMTSMGVPEEDAHHYAGRVKEGDALVMVKTPDNRADAAATLLEGYGAGHVDERSGASMTNMPRTSDPTAGEVNGSQTGTIPLVREEMQVGTRQVSRGGVRVYSHTVEEPVEQTVTLHEEHANVTRRPANREATDADFANFREGTIEVREMAEEPVVAKRARVVEEVVVGKESTQRTETVRGTVRHTEVDTERLDEPSLRDRSYAPSGSNYDLDSPGYRYGSDLATDPTYRGRDWTDVESSARSDWEKRGEGTWDSVKESIRHGWDKVTGKA